MSTVMVITPIIIANWPAITAAVAAAVGSIGFAAVQQGASIEHGRTNSITREEIEVEDSDILQGTEGTTEQMVVERDGVRAIFSRDARGALKLCMEGGGLSKAAAPQTRRRTRSAASRNSTPTTASSRSSNNAT